MDALLKQLRQAWARIAALPASVRWSLVAAGAIGLIVTTALLAGRSNDDYQYAFTNLTPEDSAEITALLAGASVPHRMEAGGAALSVPANKVYEVRLLLASAGLPRGGGVGFELFDKGDLGVSEFTKKVNLRRALEGELARTISRLSEVRSARIHLTLGEKSLFRDEDRKASATVVVNIKPGMALGDRELAGIRHLVASAVPGLTIEGVTLVDGRGAILQTQDGPGQAAVTRQRQIEQDMERRLVSLLEPIAGVGAVVARVNAQLDDSEVSVNAEVVDPEQTALRSDHKTTQAQQQDLINGGAVVAGSNGNGTNSTATAGQNGTRSSSSTDDETHNYEVSKTTTTTISKSPRLKRLSVAILLDGVEGKARGDDEVKRFGELAKRAVGLDPARGDQFEISSVAFTKAAEEPAPVVASTVLRDRIIMGSLAGVALLGIGATFVMTRRRQPTEVIIPGVRVSEAQAALEAEISVPSPALPPPAPAIDPDTAIRERARELASLDPTRSMYLLRAWVSDDLPPEVKEPVAHA
jgi:flagellar M-ring protein FliF